MAPEFYRHERIGKI